jgi:hypothetical protein
MMQVQQLPEFNPVAAGFPLTAQGYGPNEMLIDRYRGDLGPTGSWGQQRQSLMQYDLGPTGSMGQQMQPLMQYPYLGLGQYPYSPYYGLGQTEPGPMYGLGQTEPAAPMMEPGMMDKAKSWVAANPGMALAIGAAAGAGLFYAYQRYAAAY